MISCAAHEALVLSPLASSMFTPGVEQIAQDLGTTPQTVVGATTGFVVFLGFGPLVLAPLSETFGRRRLYTVVGPLLMLVAEFSGFSVDRDQVLLHVLSSPDTNSSQSQCRDFDSRSCFLWILWQSVHHTMPQHITEIWSRCGNRQRWRHHQRHVRPE